MKTMSALEVRRRFGGVLDMVARKHIHVMIARANKPLVVMVPAEEYQGGMSARETRLGLAVDKIRAWKKLNRKVVEKMDATRLLREVREGR